MPTILNRLSPPFVASASAPGLYGDGGGLYLQVSNSGAKSWLFIYVLFARRHYLGLGGISAISLRKARELAAQARELKAQGIDPLATKRAQRAAARAAVARLAIFRDEAESYVAAHQAGWQDGGKSANQWRSSLEQHVYPVIGHLSVSEIETAHLVKILEPIWSRLYVTASRVRGRIEKILDRARTRGLRQGENPARWRGHLDTILPARAKVQRVKHHPALNYQQMPAFMAELRLQDGIAARALELTILCCTRTSETTGAEPGEFDIKAKVWNIPAGRMKMKRAHRIPLTDRAVDILRPLLDGADQFVFPGRSTGKHLSNGGMLVLLERMGRGDTTTVHGLRSSFRDWAAEQTGYPSEVVEAALAHANDDAVEAAYLRTDFFEKRRKLMQLWSNFCAKPSSKGGDVVVPLKRAK